jgi:O-glycosyl hydrolase
MRFLTILLSIASTLAAQAPPLKVDFAAKRQPWDGFGVNYVEVPQTRDYKNNPQEYGGFSVLTEEKRQKILDEIFGPDGLRPGVVKMFLDVWQQETPGGPFDHETTTRWMRYFVREGLKRAQAQGGSLEIITTLYGPPAWATRQKFVRGRDLDPAQAENLARYLIAWLQFLKQKEKFPVRYISLHNEGEDFERWPIDGQGPGHATHDYNLFWPPRQVTDFMTLLRPMLDQAGLRDVGITPGEPTNWWRFLAWGYAPAIWADEPALRAMGLITSHGFTGGAGRWYGEHEGGGVELIRQKRPELHVWTTSMTWGRMDAQFVNDIRGQIYQVNVNSVIPWAAVQTSKWVGGDPNPGTAFRVIEDCGCYQILPGYYYYKQVSRAGQPGMAVATVHEGNGRLRLMAFASNGTRHPDAFVLINTNQDPVPAVIEIAGSSARAFQTFRTSLSENYQPLAPVTVQQGRLQYEAPGRSVTTFIAEK